MKAIAFVALTVALCARCSWSAFPDDIVAATRRTLLPNSTTVLVCPLKKCPSVSLAIWVRTGSFNDPEGRCGMSHLFEHLMFSGSANVPVGGLRSFVEERGGSVSALTTEDFLLFQDDFPAEILDSVLFMEADRFGTLALSESAVNAERAAVLAEREARVSGSPQAVMMEQLCGLAFPAHPYGRPPYGLPDEILDITLDDCRSYYQKYFTPSRLMIVLSGDLKADDALQAIQRTFGCLTSSGADSPSRSSAAGLERRGSRRLDFQTAEPVSRLVLSWEIPAAASNDLTYLRLLSRVIELRHTSRTDFPSVKGVNILNFSIHTDDRKSAGTFVIQSVFHELSSASDPVEGFAACFEDSSAVPVLAREAMLASELYQTDLLMALDGPHRIAARLGYYECFAGDFHKLSEEWKRAAAADADALNRVWRANLSALRRAAVLARSQRP